MALPVSFGAVIGLFASLFFGLYLLSRRWTYPYPPGPPSNPIFGNIFSIPDKGSWLLYTELMGEYGPLLFFHGLGSKVLVLNTYEAIHDLLDKRGHIYSDRPVFTAIGELMHVDQSMPLLPYGKEFREHRKLANIALSSSAVRKYHLIQEDIVALMNKSFLDNPADFVSHLRLTTGRILLSVTYGLSIATADNEYITRAEEALDLVTRASVPGAYLCDVIPLMKWLPSWTSFQREMAAGRKMIEQLVTKPFEHVKHDIAQGTAAPSLVQDLLGIKAQDQAAFEYRVKWVAGGMYGAGGESTYVTVLTFILAMALFPEKQKLAQAEIDRVIGHERMPTLDDLPQLPYVSALVKETMRWHPSVPLAVARRTMEDDVYQGYFIPKGTIVCPNTWAVSITSSGDYDPKDYVPERFLDPKCPILEPGSYAFGYGRRMCPGKALAENSIFIMISGLLSGFNISPPETGKLEPKFRLNMVSYPEPFECHISPRSDAKAAYIRSRALQTSA